MPQVTPFQERVYAALVQIPSGKVTTYAHLARALETSPRALGGALRNNPFAPEVPCHRVIAASGFIGGFKGDWEKAPSGINQTLKRELLLGEGVKFSDEGMILGGKDVYFEGPWKLQRVKEGPSSKTKSKLKTIERAPSRTRTRGKA